MSQSAAVTFLPAIPYSGRSSILVHVKRDILRNLLPERGLRRTSSLEC
jgi:hypothetical protein